MVKNLGPKGKKNVYWIFGRGVSLSCQLNWNTTEIADFDSKTRDEQLTLICTHLSEAQQDSRIDITPYLSLIDLCEKQTTPPHQHTFSTLNWDTLGEMAIDERHWDTEPDWITSSHIYHWNGTIENGGKNDLINQGLLRRSPFILPNDSPAFRQRSIEGNYAFNKMGWSHYLVICGVSFSEDNPCDETLIKLIEWVQDDLPIGECHCIIVNRSKNALERTTKKLKQFMWREIIPVQSNFDDWVKAGCPELQSLQVLD